MNSARLWTRIVPGLAVVLLATACGTETNGQPRNEQPRAEPFSAYTHCGLESIRIDGHWWHAKPPLYNKDRTGPPAGWGNPYQEGTVTVESSDRAVFEALGRRVVFVPAPDDEPVRMCR